MKSSTNQRGLSFFELLIAMAVVLVLSAIAMPAYRVYIDTANMTKVTATFEESVRFTRNYFNRYHTRIAIGIIEPMPKNSKGWIALLNPHNMQAPGGGAAFIRSKNKNDKGDPLTGAIGVRWYKAKPAKVKKNGKSKPARPATLVLWRPLYSDLVGQKVSITDETLEIEKFTN